VAVRDIAKGEEITCDYHDFDAESALKLGEPVGPVKDQMLTHSNLSSWIHPNTELRYSAHGNGIFATGDFPAGTVVAVLGGRLINSLQWCTLSDEDKRHSLQVEEEMYLAPNVTRQPDDYLNHSCEPNLGMNGHSALVTLRAIRAGEELCFDYAMTDGSDYDEFVCGCGTPSCRGKITGADWSLPELQERYRGYFSPYLTRRIERLQRESNQVSSMLDRLMNLATGETGDNTEDGPVAIAPA